jgi:hypothetical protein
LKRISESYNQDIKRISQSVVDSYGEEIKNLTKDFRHETKLFREELNQVKQNHFSVLSNCLLYIFIGAMCTFLGCFQAFFIQEKKDFIQTAVYEQTLKKGKREYKQELLSEDPTELQKLVDEWKEKWVEE